MSWVIATLITSAVASVPTAKSAVKAPSSSASPLNLVWVAMSSSWVASSVNSLSR